MARKTKDKDEAPKVRRPKRNYITTEHRTREDADLGVVRYDVSVAHFGERVEEFVGATREEEARAWLDGMVAGAKAAKRNTDPARILAKLDKAQAVLDRIGRLTVRDCAIVSVAEYKDLDGALAIFRAWLGEE